MNVADSKNQKARVATQKSGGPQRRVLTNRFCTRYIGSVLESLRKDSFSNERILTFTNPALCQVLADSLFYRVGRLNLG